MSGKKRIKDENKINQLFVYEKKKSKIMVNNKYVDHVEFEFVTKIVLKDFEEFEQVCMKFHFDNDNSDSLMFCKNDKIFTFNFRTNVIEVIHHIIE